MKKFILQLMFLTIIISGCGGGDEGTNSNPCANTISDFNVTQHNDIISIELVTSRASSFYEVSILNSTTAPNPDSGDIRRFVLNQNFTITDLGFSIGSSYVFFVRSLCDDGSKGDWSAAKNLTVNSFCHMPFDINFSSDGLTLQWANDNPSVSQYQIEYDTHGFNLGSGISALSNTNSYNPDIEQYVTYDFYIRANCNGGFGWSDWKGPYVFTSTVTSNFCRPPSDVGYDVAYDASNNPTGANFFWDNNGGIGFEYTIVITGQAPEKGIILSTQSPSAHYQLNQNTDYCFYVRTTCTDGATSAWVGPVTLNIGN